MREYYTGSSHGSVSICLSVREGIANCLYLGDQSMQVNKKRDRVSKKAVLSGLTNWARCIAINVNRMQVVFGSQNLSLQFWTHKDSAWKSTPMECHTGDIGCVSVHANEL